MGFDGPHFRFAEIKDAERLRRLPNSPPDCWIETLESHLKKEPAAQGGRFFLAEMVGFEPTCLSPDKTISSRSRYDHFDTSPYSVPLKGTTIIISDKERNSQYFLQEIRIF